MEPLIAALSAADTIPLGSPPAAPAVGPTFDEHLDRARRPSHPDRRTWNDPRESNSDRSSDGAPATPPANEKSDAAKPESTIEPAGADAPADATPSEHKDSNDAEADETTAAPPAVEHSMSVATAALVAPIEHAPTVSPHDAEANEPPALPVDTPATESHAGPTKAAQPHASSKRVANLKAEPLPAVGDTPAVYDADAALDDAAAAETVESERGPSAHAANEPPVAPTIAVDVLSAAGGSNARSAKRSTADRATRSAAAQGAASNKPTTKGGSVEPSQAPPAEVTALSPEDRAESAKPAAHVDGTESAPRVEPSPLGGQFAAEHNAEALRTADSTSAAASDVHRIEPADLRPEEASSLDAANGRLEHDANAATADRARFVERVARAFRAADQRGGPVRLRLSPPELGAVRVEIEIRDGALIARLGAETAEARGLLLDGLPQLRERLAGQDLRIERFEVELSDGSSGHSSGERSRDGAHGDRSGASFAPRHEAQRTGRVSTAVAGARTKSSEGRLDVVI